MRVNHARAFLYTQTNKHCEKLFQSHGVFWVSRMGLRSRRMLTHQKEKFYTN